MILQNMPLKSHARWPSTLQPLRIWKRLHGWTLVVTSLLFYGSFPPNMLKNIFIPFFYIFSESSTGISPHIIFDNSRHTLQLILNDRSQNWNNLNLLKVYKGTRKVAQFGNTLNRTLLDPKSDNFGEVRARKKQF